MFETESLCVGVKAPSFLSFSTATVSVLLCLLTVPGNLLVCLAIYKDPYKDLRSPFMFFLSHLAVADLIVGVVTEPISVYLHIREGLQLSLNNIWLIHMSYFISCTASVLSIAALTMDRYVAITYPLKYRAAQGSNKTHLASILIWVIAFTVPFTYFKVGYIPYTFVFANTSIVVTFVILIVIFVKIRKSSRSRVVMVGGPTDIRDRIMTREKKITTTFLIVLISFASCYTPSCVMIYIMNLCVSCSCKTLHWLRDMQFVFVLLSSATNPLIYAWRLVTFRKAFIAMVTRKTRVVSQNPRSEGIINVGSANISHDDRPAVLLDVKQVSS